MLPLQNSNRHHSATCSHVVHTAISHVPASKDTNAQTALSPSGLPQIPPEDGAFEDHTPAAHVPAGPVSMDCTDLPDAWASPVNAQLHRSALHTLPLDPFNQNTQHLQFAEEQSSPSGLVLTLDLGDDDDDENAGAPLQPNFATMLQGHAAVGDMTAAGQLSQAKLNTLQVNEFNIVSGHFYM